MNYLPIVPIVICAATALLAFVYIIYFEQEKRKAKEKNELLVQCTLLAAEGVVKCIKAHKSTENARLSQEPVYSWDGKNGGIIGKHGRGLND